MSSSISPQPPFEGVTDASVTVPLDALRRAVARLSERLELLGTAALDEAIETDRVKIEQAGELLGSLAWSPPIDSEKPSNGRHLRHDMRNAIGVIAGYGSLIEETLADEGALNEELSALFQRLQAESERLLEALAEPAASAAEASMPTSEIEDLLESLGEQAGDQTLITGQVLVVDDNENSRQLLARQLTAQGHRVMTADSGRSALAMMKDSPPDLVLLDLMMPDLNGFEVLHAMKAELELRNVPVIVTTGLHDQRGVVRCIEAGAQDYLLKPVNPTLLRARMRSCLERKAWHDREQSYQRELERSHAFIRQVFGRYLSDDIVQQLLDNEDGLKLGGGVQKVTLIMTDLRGFTELSQRLPPKEVVTLLNIYLQAMSEVIVRYGGTIDEIIGDAILVLFGAPLVRPDDAARAVACAIEMQNAMQSVNETAAAHGLPAVEMGIGLNTGEVVVGNIGSEIRSKYAVVGHHVNLTGRIESFTVGSQILASQFTVAELAGQVSLGESIEVDAKGIEQTVRLHEIIGLGPPWSVELERTRPNLKSLKTPLNVTVTRLSDNQLDDAGIGGRLEALGGNHALLFSEQALAQLSNLRLRFEPLVAGKNRGEKLDFYAKVTRCCTVSGPGRYHVTLTSVGAGARLQALIDNATHE